MENAGQDEAARDRGRDAAFDGHQVRADQDQCVLVRLLAGMRPCLSGGAVETAVNAFETHAGAYEGTGEWHDSAGASMTYAVHQTVGANANGFEIAFKHDF